jgi:hypothetical protein
LVSASPHGSTHQAPSPPPLAVVLFVSLFLLCGHCWWSWDGFVIVRKKDMRWVCDGFLTAEEHVIGSEMGLDFFLESDGFGFGGGNLKGNGLVSNGAV